MFKLLEQLPRDCSTPAQAYVFVGNRFILEWVESGLGPIGIDAAYIAVDRLDCVGKCPGWDVKNRIFSAQHRKIQFAIGCFENLHLRQVRGQADPYLTL